MENNEYISLTELGQLYRVSSHAVGKWLKILNLRMQNGKPSPRAFYEGFVSQQPSRQPDTFFYVWNRKMTTELLDRMEYPRVKTESEEAVQGEFTVRQQADSDGQEILNADGEIICWTLDASLSKKKLELTQSMN